MYGAPAEVTALLDTLRGPGSYGVLEYGSCGFTNKPQGTLPYPRDAVAASADTNSDYPGSCGRCYEIRCKTGYILDNTGSPMRLEIFPNGTINAVGYYQVDGSRLPAIRAAIRDSQGRSYAGNPAAPEGRSYTQCHDSDKTVRVRVIDSCPCTQVLPDGAPGVKPGGEVRRQEWCCGPMPHFDLSWWAFEQLAHPLSGSMMLQYRPVDCDSGAPLPPNFISKVIYGSRGMRPGWSWEGYGVADAQLSVPGKWAAVPGVGPTGGAATCLDVTPGGGLTLRMRRGSEPGFQPFKNAQRVDFWIRPGGSSNGPEAASKPQCQVTQFKLFLMVDSVAKQQYCFKEVVLGVDVQPVTAANGWLNFQVDMAAFQCSGALEPDRLNRLDFQNIGTSSCSFCLTGLEIVA
ncbi:hypothetical protein QJQ45_025065 [Haematococcus lacustris]|nr:hypothetical protein QJQ45_025065 [Haematococcus lacustris]